MKHLLFGACGMIALAACGSVVVVDGEPSADGGQGGGATVATTAATTGATTAGETTGETAGSGAPAQDCSMDCGPNDGSTCQCVRTCAPSPDFIKVVCAPTEDGHIECVCTLGGGTFSAACYEINDAACNFEEGCCAKYISGK
jgi:hypothetical protein